jgi:DNA segregation ATPase FtsK/SpoIIIE-like protein
MSDSSEDGLDVDELFENAARFVIDAQKASASLLQRHLNIGYARAARILDQLERFSIVTASDGAKPREVTIKTAEEYEKMDLNTNARREEYVLKEPDVYEWHRPFPGEISNPILKTFVDAQKENKTLEVVLGMKKDVIFSRSLASLRNLLIIGPANDSRRDILITLITSLISVASPDEAKLILIDHQGISFSIFNGSPHLITPVIIDSEKSTNALGWALNEIESRLKLFREVGVRNIGDYNALSGFQAMPRIIIVINSFESSYNYADEIKYPLIRIAEIGGSVGFHLVLAGTSDDKRFLPSEMSNNFSNRIYFKSTSLVHDDTFDTALIDRLKNERDAFYVDLFNAPVVFRTISLGDKVISDLLTLMRG